MPGSKPKNKRKNRPETLKILGKVKLKKMFLFNKLYLNTMENYLKLVLLLGIILFAGCLANQNKSTSDGPAPIIGYSCKSLTEVVSITNGKINSCSFTLQTPDEYIYTLSGKPLENFQEIILDAQCNEVLPVEDPYSQYYSQKILIDSQNTIFGCIGHRGE